MAAELSLTNYQREALAAITVVATRDAEMVTSFLGRLGLPASPEKPCSVPACFLQNLAVALRLCVWEGQGFTFHCQAGLPAGRDALRAAFQSLSQPNDDGARLHFQVTLLAIDRFAWHGWNDLEADVAIDDLVEDAALDALAEYLWATRHEGSMPETSQT